MAPPRRSRALPLGSGNSATGPRGSVSADASRTPAGRTARAACAPIGSDRCATGRSSAGRLCYCSFAFSPEARNRPGYYLGGSGPGMFQAAMRRASGLGPRQDGF